MPSTDIERNGQKSVTHIHLSSKVNSKKQTIPNPTIDPCALIQRLLPESFSEDPAFWRVCVGSESFVSKSATGRMGKQIPSIFLLLSSSETKEDGEFFEGEKKRLTYGRISLSAINPPVDSFPASTAA